MRILHVVTLVSPEGELGGPLRVAVTQLRELQRKGHEVLLAAGARGFEGALPEEYQGVPVKLFPAVQAVPGTGFAGVAAPGMVPWLAARAGRFDAIHLHFARDLVLVPAAAVLLARRIPFAAQTHGMVVPSAKRLAKVLDALVVRRTLRTAQTVFALVPKEQRELAEVEPRGRYVVLPNGLDLSTPVPSADPASSRDVLFLARMAPRKRPMDFAEAAARLAPEFPEWTFSLVGPDEGEGEAVQEFCGSRPELGGRVRWEGPLAPDLTAVRMAEAAVYVLPAENEPFGMTVIEAQRAGLPAVFRTDCGLAEGARAAEAAVLYEPGRHESGLRESGAHESGAEELAAALRPLLASAELRTAVGRRGREHVHARFGIDRVAERLEAAYATLGAGRPQSAD